MSKAATTSYVFADKSLGNIALVQSLLEQVALQQYQESCSLSGRVIKPVQALFTRSKNHVGGGYSD